MPSATRSAEDDGPLSRPGCGLDDLGDSQAMAWRAHRCPCTRRLALHMADATAARFDRDAFIGANDGTGRHSIPRQPPPRRRLSALPRFVAMRSGEYLLLPGIATVAEIAASPMTRNPP